jgi:hypothetical protein
MFSTMLLNSLRFLTSPLRDDSVSAGSRAIAARLVQGWVPSHVDECWPMPGQGGV